MRGGKNENKKAQMRNSQSSNHTGKSPITEKTPFGTTFLYGILQLNSEIFKFISHFCFLRFSKNCHLLQRELCALCHIVLFPLCTRLMRSSTYCVNIGVVFVRLQANLWSDQCQKDTHQLRDRHILIGRRSFFSDSLKLCSQHQNSWPQMRNPRIVHYVRSQRHNINSCRRLCSGFPVCCWRSKESE